MKKCPYCAEDIQDAASVCKYCRRDIPTAMHARSLQLQRTWLWWAFGIFVGLTMVGFCARTITPSPSRATATAAVSVVTPTPTQAAPAPQTVKTARGMFTVPGRARLDGAGEVPNINIWDEAHRRRVVCSLPDRTAIDLLDSYERYDERRFYFRVRAAGCEGWVPESFVAPSS